MGGYTKDDWDAFLANGTIDEKVAEVKKLYGNESHFNDFDPVEFLNLTGPNYYIMSCKLGKADCRRGITHCY